ncbi:MAG: sensor histidine kinase [Actinomycetota bacterium]
MSGHRDRGISVRLRLTLSYAGVLLVAGVLLLAAVWGFLLRHVPDGNISTQSGFVPNRSDLLEAFAPAAVAVMVFLLVFGVLGGWFLAGRMLAPVSRITRATRLAAGGSLSHRIDLPGRSDEFRELADAFDDMLARLEAHSEEQQRFAANASHELRTPLAITKTLLELAVADSTTDVERLRRLQAVNTRAIHLTEALLTLSRAEVEDLAAEELDLSLLAEEAVENLRSLADERAVALTVAGDIAPMRGSEALLSPLATNLVHNAIVHNVAGGTVRVEVATRSDAAVLTVENTGVPIDPASLTTLTEAFQRGAGRTRSEHGGVGLGLAIVDRIVRAHAGELTLTARAGGGLVAVVELPLAPQRPVPPRRVA